MKLVLIALAVAHNWYSGHHDPVTGYECCDNKDCRCGNFNIRTGSKTRYFIPKNRVLESEDSQ